MALLDFFKIALFPLNKWAYFLGQLTISSKAVQFLLACQLFKVGNLRSNEFLENYECPCKQFSSTNN